MTDLADYPAYLNGLHLRLGEAQVPVLDRGFIFGDGVYEVVPVYGRRAFRLPQHLARLARSLGRIRIDPPHDDRGWQAIVARLVERAPWDDQYVYLQVTRGVAARDFGFPAGVLPTVFAMVSPFRRPTAAQRDAGLAAVLWPDERWLHCDIKSVSLLGAVLARQAAIDRGADEAVQLRDGYLTEGSASNIWVVKGGTVLAPPRDHLILEGIRYGLVEELCGQAGIPFQVRRIRGEEVIDADELLLTAATRELLPITRLDGAPVGTGQPGPVYARLRAGYDAAIAALATP